MGKYTKSKGKKSAKQERALHLKNVELFEKTILTFEKIFNSRVKRRHVTESVMLYMQ